MVAFDAARLRRGTSRLNSAYEVIARRVELDVRAWASDRAAMDSDILSPAKSRPGARRFWSCAVSRFGVPKALLFVMAPVATLCGSAALQAQILNRRPLGSHTPIPPIQCG